MIENQENKAVTTAKKPQLNKAQVAIALALSALVSSPAFAEGEMSYPTIDFSAIPFGTWMAAVMAFALMAGMAFVGLSALISVTRKSRGAVR